MVAKKKQPPAWGDTREAEKPAPDDTADNMHAASPPEDFTPPAFLTGGKPANDPVQEDLEDAIAETKPENPEPFMTTGGEAAESGGNEPDPAPKPGTPVPDVDMSGDNANKALIGYIERVERLAEEKAAIQDDMKEVHAEIKAAGFDNKIVREVLRRRKMDPADRAEHDSMLEIYEESLR